MQMQLASAVECSLPSWNSGVNGASTLNGWTPVNLINRGSRATWPSGVSLSMLKTSDGLFEGGGNGISGISGVSSGGTSCSSTLIWEGLRVLCLDGPLAVRTWVTVVDILEG